MQKTIYLEPAQVPLQLRRDYAGKMFRAIITDSVTIPASAGNWCEGSRDTYEIVKLDNGAAVAASDNISAPWDEHRADRNIELKPGFAVVRHCISCGKDLGLTFYMHAENAAKLLPAPAAELTETQRRVLEATKTYKASYNGKDRYSIAADNTRYSNPPVVFPSRQEWETAKLELIALGLLNKAGAITTKGRNAI